MNLLAKIRRINNESEIAQKIMFYMFRSRFLSTVCFGAYDIFCQILPEEQVKYEQVFFKEHAEELNLVYDMLEDSRSKLVYENILKYRMTRKRKYLKNIIEQDNQYFVKELGEFGDGDLFVDCGAFDGTEAIKFNTFSGGKGRIVSFEPVEKNYNSLLCLNLKNYKPLQYGVWSSSTTLSWSGSSSNGNIGEFKKDRKNEVIEEVEVKAIDDMSECADASFIKMDIEGAELEALKGAAKTIMSKHPRLAICIYHKPQDFYEIPMYIKSLNPAYRFYVHHHSKTTWETVLYAISEN